MFYCVDFTFFLVITLWSESAWKIKNTDITVTVVKTLCWAQGTLKRIFWIKTQMFSRILYYFFFLPVPLPMRESNNKSVWTCIKCDYNFKERCGLNHVSVVTQRAISDQTFIKILGLVFFNKPDFFCCLAKMGLISKTLLVHLRDWPSYYFCSEFCGNRSWSFFPAPCTQTHILQIYCNNSFWAQRSPNLIFSTKISNSNVFFSWLLYFLYTIVHRVK